MKALEYHSRNRFLCAKVLRTGETQMTLTVSVGGLDGSLPQIFSYLKNLGIPSAFSDFTLVFFSLWSAFTNAHKTVFPAMKLNALYWREKNRNFKIQMLCEQEE